MHGAHTTETGHTLACTRCRRTVSSRTGRVPGRDLSGRADSGPSTGHDGPHRIMLNGQPGTWRISYAELTREALHHATGGTGWRTAAPRTAPGPGQWDEWLRIAYEVIDRADAIRAAYPGNWWFPRESAHYEVEVSTVEWVALAESLGDAVDYMITNNYGNDEDFPEAARAARAFTGVDGKPSLAAVEICWAGRRSGNAVTGAIAANCQTA